MTKTSLIDVDGWMDKIFNKVHNKVDDLVFIFCCLGYYGTFILLMMSSDDFSKYGWYLLGLVIAQIVIGELYYLSKVFAGKNHDVEDFGVKDVIGIKMLGGLACAPLLIMPLAIVAGIVFLIGFAFPSIMKFFIEYGFEILITVGVIAGIVGVIALYFYSNLWIGKAVVKKGGKKNE